MSHGRRAMSTAPAAAPGPVKTSDQNPLDKPQPPPYKPPSATLRRPGAQVAQLVEHATENRSVGGSIPPLGTIKINNLTDAASVNRSRLDNGRDNIE